MCEESLLKQYAILAFNGDEVSCSGVARNLRSHCIVVAYFLDLILERKLQEADGKYRYEQMKEENFPQDRCFLKKEDFFFIEEWIKFISELDINICNSFTEKVINDLVKERDIDIIPALVESDYDYRMAGLKVKQYRSDFGLYHKVVDDFKGELLREKPCNYAICLFWLLQQSNYLNNVFYEAERNQAQEKLAEVLKMDSFASKVLECRITAVIEKGLKNILTETADRFKREVIFIEVEKLFPNASDIITEVKNILECRGHICQVKFAGAVPVMEIDNMLYQCRASAKRVRVINIHGVKLSRCEM